MHMLRLSHGLFTRARPACYFFKTTRSSRSTRSNWHCFASLRPLTIIHFNDVYDISPRTIEPVGGAARFSHLVQKFSAERPLILFSGDCLNPSLLSAFTRGEQMVPILNGIGVHAAACGNHDFDFGTEVLRQHMAAWNFPWLLSNVLDAVTGEPLAGAHRSLVLDWQGHKIGLLGLVEREWLLTIPSLDCTTDIIYLDFVEEGRKLSKELLESEGVDFVIALTHMRSPNDAILAAAVPEIALLLGGHDHDYSVTQSSPFGTVIVKSGTDFREFSVIRMETRGGQQQQEEEEKEGETVAADKIEEKLSSSLSTSSTSASSSSSSSSSCTRSTTPHGRDTFLKSIKTFTSPGRPSVSVERIEVTTSAEEDPTVAAIVHQYQHLMGTRMDQPLGRSFVDIDTRFDRVRTQETNAGNLMGDIMKLGLDSEVAFLNGGTIRSDQIHASGRLSMRDFVSMLPFTDELVVLSLSGSALLAALETGVSSWPKREGRFLQVAGVAFRFDPGNDPGSRIVPGSVHVAGAPLDLGRKYRVATKAYLRSGKDGFDSLLNADVEVDGETAPRLATLVHHLLSRIEELNEAVAANTDTSDAEESTTNITNTNTTMPMPNKGNVISSAAERERHLRAACSAPLPLPPCAHNLDALYYYDDVTGQFGIAPCVEGRIVNTAVE